MKVDKSVKSTASTPVQGGSGRSSVQTPPAHNPKTSSSGGAATPNSTSVHIGEAASQLQNAIAAAPALDMNKVAAVRQAISEGRFQVNAQAVANGLISSVHQLIQSQNR